MFCSRCGKKINEDMLFCPFCGASVVIPKQDESEPKAPVEPAETPAAGSKVFVRRGQQAGSTVSRQTYAIRKPADYTYVPRENAAPVPEAAAKPEPRPTPSVYDIETPAPEVKPEPPKEADDIPDADVEDRFKWNIPKMPAIRKVPLTKPAFDDDDDDDAYDEIDRREKKHPHRKYTRHLYDEIDDTDDDDDDDDIDDFEDSFITRHLRGLIGGLLLLVLIMVLLIYLFSNSGQDALARANLAWKPDAYSRLGYNCYQTSDYLNAGRYYEQALKRSPESYEYATSAALAYIAALDDSSTERMLKEAIRIRPSASEPYLRLMSMYPDPATRPEEIALLLKQGYQITGDSRLAPQ